MSNGKSDGYELRVEYLLNVPRASIWRCWTDPKLLEQWFHPEFWTTQVKALELHAGGASHIIMRGPDGEVSEGLGVFLDVVPGRRLVFTNAYTPGWIPCDRPAGAPLRTMIIEMFEEAGKTRYVVRALHWTEEARKQHEKIGFHHGWKQTTGRLETLARSLRTAPN